jgi:hypothetical protein
MGQMPHPLKRMFEILLQKFKMLMFFKFVVLLIVGY